MKRTNIVFAVIPLLISILIGLPALHAQDALRPSHGVVLTPLDAAMVDDALRSSNSATPALIDFVNQSSSAVDIYWINFQGERVLYATGHAVGATGQVHTFMTHPWLVILYGTGGTTAHDTGVRVAGFEALTPNGDTAIIAKLAPAYPVVSASPNR